MRPKCYFVFKTALLIILVAVAFIAVLFLSSFLMFCMCCSGIFFIGILALIFLLIIFMEKITSEVSYRKPLVYSLLFMIILILVFSSAINRMKFHERIERRNLPMIRRIYKVPRPEFEIKSKRMMY